MGHLEISGFQMYRGQYSENGYDRELFRRFDTIFSGHFHHKSDDGQIYYLGTPYQITWSDFDDPKGFHIFDTDTRELERIVNPYTLFSKIFYDDTQEDYNNHDVEKYEEKFVKLIVVNKKDLYDFDPKSPSRSFATPRSWSFVSELIEDDDDEGAFLLCVNRNIKIKNPLTEPTTRNMLNK